MNAAADLEPEGDILAKVTLRDKSDHRITGTLR